MATIKLTLDREKKDGTCSINIAVGHKGEEKYIQTGYFVVKSSAKIKNGVLWLPSGYQMGRSIVNKTSEMMMSAQSFVAKTRADRMTCSQLRDKVKNMIFSSSGDEDKTFAYAYKEFMAKKEGSNTHDVYQCTWNRLNDYTDMSLLSFEDINAEWLTRFEKWLAPTNKVNSIAIHMRNIRAVFNYAITEEYTECYPFRKYKIRKETTASRALTLSQLRCLKNYDVEEWQKRYVDLFLIIFGLRGINMEDLSKIKNIDADGYIRYTRAKTHKDYQVKVESEVLELINKNKGKEHLLSYFDTNTDQEQVAKQLTRALRKVGESETMARTHATGPLKRKVKPLFPNITAYWARHTLASIAYNDAELDMDTISDILGHSSGLSVTNIYVNRNQKRIDQAMRKVLDLIYK